MYESPTGHAVRECFELIARQPAPPNDAERAFLEGCLRAAVDELKSMGWPIERIIARLKEFAYEVGLTREPDNRSAILSQIVRASIDRYYVVIPPG